MSALMPIGSMVSEELILIFGLLTRGTNLNKIIWRPIKEESVVKSCLPESPQKDFEGSLNGVIFRLENFEEKQWVRGLLGSGILIVKKDDKEYRYNLSNLGYSLWIVGLKDVLEQYVLSGLIFGRALREQLKGEFTPALLETTVCIRQELDRELGGSDV